MSVGYLLSSFDMLNVGDLGVIDRAAMLCDELVVGVLTDEDVEFTMGRPPVIPQGERLELVSHVRGVARAVSHTHGVEESADLVLVHVDHSRLVDDLGTGVGVLVPEVETSSPILRSALRPARLVDSEAVA